MRVESGRPVERLFRDCAQRPIHLNLCRYSPQAEGERKCSLLPESIDKNNEIKVNDQESLPFWRVSDPMPGGMNPDHP
jgi:hypothetical protein